MQQLCKHLEKQMNPFKLEIPLSCRNSCGQCCSIPDINASPVEFIPWAFYLFLNGKAEDLLEKLNTKTNPNGHLFQSLSIIDHAMSGCSG